MDELEENEAGQITLSPAGMGDRQEIAAAHRRLAALFPGAAAFPAEVLWSLAQLAVVYRLDPFNGEIYAAKMGREKTADGSWQDRYVVMIGIKGFRALAHRQSLYTTAPPHVLGADEVAALRRELYDPGDIGVEVSLYRLDVARQCKQVGVPYYPSIGRGFYRIKGKAIRDNKGEVTGYHPDPIPETWTALDVAEKRAEKQAITKAYDLRFDPGVLRDGLISEDELDGAIEAMVSQRDRETSITVRPSKVIEEEGNGDVLYARS